MSDFEVKNALSSDSESLELNDTELNAISGGCGDNFFDRAIKKADRWLHTDDGPNVARKVSGAIDKVKSWL